MEPRQHPFGPPNSLLLGRSFSRRPQIPGLVFPLGGLYDSSRDDTAEAALKREVRDSSGVELADHQAALYLCVARNSQASNTTFDYTTELDRHQVGRVPLCPWPHSLHPGLSFIWWTLEQVESASEEWATPDLGARARVALSFLRGYPPSSETLLQDLLLED